MYKRENIAALIIMMFSIVTGVVSVTRYGLTSSSGPGAGFFPFLAACLLFILALILLAGNVLKARRNGDRAVDEDKKLFPRPAALLKYFGLFALSALLLEPLGFVIVSSVFMALICKMIRPSEVTWKKAIVFGVVSSVLAYGVFTYALQVELPKGVLPV